MGSFARQDFPDGIVEALGELEAVGHRRLPFRRSFFGGVQGTMPCAVRLKSGAKPLPLDQVITEVLYQGVVHDEPCPWITDIPLPRVTIRRLVEAHRGDLLPLLRFVGDRRPAGASYHPRLKVQDSQRILKICRGTTDEEVLQGAASILMHASIARIAEPDLIVKLLSAAPIQPTSPASIQHGARVLHRRRCRPSREGVGHLTGGCTVHIE